MKNLVVKVLVFITNQNNLDTPLLRVFTLSFKSLLNDNFYYINLMVSDYEYRTVVEH